MYVLGRFSLDLYYAEDFVRRYGGFWVSRRDGLVIVKVRIGDRTALVWFRSSPITEKALKLFVKVSSKHRFDIAYVVRPEPIADYVGFDEIENAGLKIVLLDEFLNIIKQ